MRRVRIYFTVRGFDNYIGYDDYLELRGSSVEDIRAQAQAEMKTRGVQPEDWWSLELN